VWSPSNRRVSSLSQLTRLPDAIGCLTRLQKLNFADNKLTDVPLSLGNIYGMQVYDPLVMCFFHYSTDQ
jgi:Leucine-rich repeat (LRR) protein